MTIGAAAAVNVTGCVLVALEPQWPASQAVAIAGLLMSTWRLIVYRRVVTHPLSPPLPTSRRRRTARWTTPGQLADAGRHRGQRVVSSSPPPTQQQPPPPPPPSLPVAYRLLDTPPSYSPPPRPRPPADLARGRHARQDDR